MYDACVHMCAHTHTHTHAHAHTRTLTLEQAISARHHKRIWCESSLGPERVVTDTIWGWEINERTEAVKDKLEHA